ncbi:MAG TPA: PAS domain S-box protein [Vicinamibacterales bacterium]|nr:PAS domain S-box protein [Vicinamibacterales bacterium]
MAAGHHAQPAAEWRAYLSLLSEALRPLTDPAAIQRAACRVLAEHLRADEVAYADVIDGHVVLDAVRAFGDAAIGALERGGSLVINDTAYAGNTLSPAARSALQRLGIASIMVAGLAKNGHPAAMLTVTCAAPRVWSPTEIAILEETAERAWTAVEHARVEAALRESEKRQAFLLRLNDALQPLSDPFERQQAAAKLLGEHLQVTHVCYADIVDDYIVRHTYADGVPPYIGHGPISPLGFALLSAYERGDVVAVDDVRTDTRFTSAERTTLLAGHIAAFAGLMLMKNGRRQGAFGVHSATPRVWTSAEVSLIRDVAERTWEAVERAHAHTIVREREQRLRLALEASAGGSWTWDARTNQLDWDAAFRERYGFAADEPARSDAWIESVHEEDRARILGFLDDILRTPTTHSWDNTFRIVRPDGSVAWIQSLGRADRAADGQLLRLTGLDLDITERRRAEEALRARQDEERDRELHLLLETAAQGIVSVDASGVIVTANRALESMFGWGHGMLIGEPLERLMPSALREAHARHRSEYFRTPHPRLMGVDLDLIGERKDGSTFPVEVTLNHVATPGGGRAIAFVTDISARKRAESALQERTFELQQRTKQLRQLASDLTLAEQHAREQLAKTLHDGLQQLLVGAAMNLDLEVKRAALGGAPPADSIADAKHQLDEAITAARSLSFELFPPVLHRSGLPAAMAWLAEWTRQKYGVEVDVSADPLAQSDRKDVRTLLFESVRELLFNAVKHAHVDRVVVDLRLGADDELCITVSDDGVGFDPARLADQSKSSQVGWGLFSIRERLTLLGGRFDVESAPGHGARFRLAAPRHAAVGTPELAGYGSLRALSKDGATPPAARALRVLIADDHAAMRKVLRAWLQVRPELLVVGDATNGIEAIEQARTQRPDVILMDVSMPEMDGVEATRRIRAELPLVQILGLSMQSRTGELHAIEQAGAAGFFTKGLDTQRLIDQLLVMHASISLALPGSG